MPADAFPPVHPLRRLSAALQRLLSPFPRLAVAAAAGRPGALLRRFAGVGALLSAPLRRCAGASLLPAAPSRRSADGRAVQAKAGGTPPFAALRHGADGWADRRMARPSAPLRPSVARLAAPLRPRLALPILLLAALAACGGAPRNRPMAPVTQSAPRFDDAKPVDWPGRSPRAYAVHGIDISRWNTGIDWAVAQAAGVSFAFIKATEGGDHIDPEFRYHWAEARRAGVPRGAYHFWYHCRGGAEQADWFIRNVPREAGALPPVLDLEWPRSRNCPVRPDGAHVRREARIFLDRLEAYYGQRPIIYTTPDFYRDTGIGEVRAEFWLRAVADHPSAVYPGQGWTFWQHTGTGLIEGIPGKVDINAFRGNPAAWAQWLTARRQ